MSDAVGPLLVRVSGIVESHYARVARGEGLSVQHSRILVFARRSSPNMAAIGEEFGLGKSTLTGIVARMEADGLVARTPDPADRRNLIVSATPRGAEVADRMVSGVRAAVTRLLRDVEPADREALGRVLGTILDDPR